MGAAAAIIVRRQRELVETFTSAGATSPESARDPGELGVERDHIFKGLENRAVLRESGNGRYYVDEPSWRAVRRMRHRMAFVMTAIVIIIGAIFFLQSRMRA